jgi:hypothetical protein
MKLFVSKSPFFHTSKFHFHQLHKSHTRAYISLIPLTRWLAEKHFVTPAAAQKTQRCFRARCIFIKLHTRRRLSICNSGVEICYGVVVARTHAERERDREAAQGRCVCVRPFTGCRRRVAHANEPPLFRFEAFSLSQFMQSI